MSRNSFSAWIGAAALALASVACDNTAEGVKRDADENTRAASDATADARESASESTARASESAERAGERAADAVRDAGQKTGDAVKDAGRATDAAVQTMDVKSALIADKRIDASNINVDTDATTKTVILKGHVPTSAQKTVAGEIASAKAEGYKVKNELRVG